MIYLLYVKKIWKNDDIPYYAAVCIGGFIGITIGFSLSKRIDRETFQRCLLALLLTASAGFVSYNIQPQSLLVGISALTIVVGAFLGWLILPPPDSKDEGDLQKKTDQPPLGSPE